MLFTGAVTPIRSTSTSMTTTSLDDLPAPPPEAAGPDVIEDAGPTNPFSARAIERPAVSLDATPQLEALTSKFSRLLRPVDGGYELTGADLADLRHDAAAIPDRVQRDLALSALAKIEVQGGPGPQVFLNDARARLLSPALTQGYRRRSTAILRHPAIERLRTDPGRTRQLDELSELLIRYANDPVFLATIHQHLARSGGLTNAKQMWAGEDQRKLHDVDDYFGQCNETQKRTAEIFAQFSAFRPEHSIEGFEVTERSRVLLAYGLMGDAPGDAHYLFGISVEGVGTLYLDPWLDQRADQQSITDPASYQARRDSYDSSHWYEEHR